MLLFVFEEFEVVVGAEVGIGVEMELEIGVFAGVEDGAIVRHDSQSKHSSQSKLE
jgi:fructose/tagatose bisphosphate aldolase